MQWRGPGRTTSDEGARSIRKTLLFASTLLAFIVLADGLAMTLPGQSGGLRGAGLVVAGLIWLFAILPRFMTPAGRAFNPVLITRIGLLALPILCAPVALGWYVATPAALNVWFAVAWAVVWLGCLAATALLPCPACGGPFGRVGLQVEIRSSRCAHCGVDARANEISES